MLPDTYDDLSQGFDVKEPATKTYRLNFDGSPSSGMLDGLEAAKQAIFLILRTERFAHEMYSWNYGVELEDNLGRPNTLLLQAKIKGAIEEALLQDSRVQSVDDFVFSKSGTGMSVSFVVSTTEGNVASELMWSGSSLEVVI